MLYRMEGNKSLLNDNYMFNEIFDPLPSEHEQDLGLGFKVTQSQKSRFINRDGTFNVYRSTRFGRGWFSIYHAILAASWTYFFFWIIALFIVANIIFAATYLITGPESFPQLANLGTAERYGQLFLYSVQILTSLGASPLHPVTTWAFIILDIESAVGLLGFAVATGLILARFSNPATKIMFSEMAVIAPYKDITGFMFRIINGRSNELIEVSATVTLAVIDSRGQRQFRQLALERDMVLVFPLNWTIVHPINDSSPLWRLSAEDLSRANAEFLIAITALDRNLSRKAYARFSYLYDEVIMGAKFATMIDQAPDGSVIAKPHLLSKIEKT
jgi:inward rectifier potassium channel